MSPRVRSNVLNCKTEIVRRGDTLYWRIAHDRQVDGLLMELTDLFISIRYAHPILVQLELVLPALSGVESSFVGSG